MTVDIQHEEPKALEQYATVPIGFLVREVLDIETPESGLGGFQLVTRKLAVPYVKNYDADPRNNPSEWPARFDLSRWGILIARVGGTPVGGAVVAWRTAGVDALEGRDDLAVLWDIRVTTASRGQGIGTLLFQAAELWAAEHGAQWLKAETQNVNLPACRFYASQGCVLGALNRFAYPSLQEEAQLLWYKRLLADGG
jgi:GNAT superfamily N-acetyltransferase